MDHRTGRIIFAEISQI